MLHGSLGWTVLGHIRFASLYLVTEGPCLKIPRICRMYCDPSVWTWTCFARCCNLTFVMAKHYHPQNCTTSHNSKVPKKQLGADAMLCVRDIDIWSSHSNHERIVCFDRICLENRLVADITAGVCMSWRDTYVIPSVLLRIADRAARIGAVACYVQLASFWAARYTIVIRSLELCCYPRLGCVLLCRCIETCCKSCCCMLAVRCCLPLPLPHEILQQVQGKCSAWCETGQIFTYMKPWESAHARI